ncbi:MAG: helix-hairpin-helix domain-containing protein [Gemmatimonadaceae bacterium]|nr:helix-hairpin-helix domain-containing protein [Gemmatimonadaceae bacterium]
MDRAGIEELDRLPGIGPALAARIIANRDSAGAYGSLEALQQVKGIGPALAAKLAPYVTFSGLPRPTQSGRPAARRAHP